MYILCLVKVVSHESQEVGRLRLGGGVEEAAVRRGAARGADCMFVLKISEQIVNYEEGTFPLISRPNIRGINYDQQQRYW